MKYKTKFLSVLALLCAVMQGAWAQNEWDAIYTQTQTTSADWTALNGGSTTGRTLGNAGATTYYEATSDLSFTNSNAGGSGLKIQGIVYLYVPSGKTITCTGANANGQTGAGAGIELAVGNSLYLIGGGTINARGGNAANGSNGSDGTDATGYDGDWTQTGAGGNGGNGGGGAGAGIGSRGGNGGSGGTGGRGQIYADWKLHNGTNGTAGSAGATAVAMGTIYVYQAYGTTVNANGGTAGTSGGRGGGRGRGYAWDGYSYNYTVAGGGGGGAGGFGGAASNIGTGGPGGGGGGGGAGGAQDYKSNSTGGVYDVTAPGGKGGKNANGSSAADGTEAGTTGTAQSQGWVTVDNGSFKSSDWNPASGDVTFGNGGGSGACGNACTGGFIGSVAVDWTTQENDWDLICLQTGTTRANWSHLTDGGAVGRTLGAAGTTTYYYTAFNDLTFSNSNAGGSGLTILGTVYLYIPSGKQITCTGINASGTIGGGAGIELTAGNKLYLIGSGKLVATGGNAANGGNGGNGGDADWEDYDYASGAGGNGGDGGGGAGAGIGTRGANGGAGGAGGAKNYQDDTTGNVGNNGQNGSTAADMGTLYIYEGSQAITPQTTIQGGRQGASGKGGAGGRHALKKFTPLSGVPQSRTMGGGAGGAGGGFGGAASNIGTGGAGGGGGGGGASGSIQYRRGTSFYRVGALGGKPGANADGTITAGSGANTEMTNTENLSVENMGSSKFPDAGWQDGDNRAAGGSGGGCGSGSKGSTAIAVITLADTGTNDVDAINGHFANVTLAGRTFYKNGEWNTLCLPFDVTLSGSTLDGAVARPLTSAAISGTTLHLQFGDAVTTLQAGTPYIIKWTSGSDIVNPVFNGVTIDATERSYDNGQSGDERVRFLGTYASQSFDAEDKSILFMGDGNMLYYPASGASIGAQRAYFKIGEDGALNAPVRLTAFSIGFGDGETTGIIPVHGSGFTVNGSDTWYDMQGRKLGGKPSRSGVYIYKDKKRVIK